MRIHARRALAMLGAAALVACGGDSPTEPAIDPPPVPAATVQASPSLQFTPGRVTLLLGGTVTFVFGSVAHNVFFDNAPAGAPANITAPTASTSLTRTFNTVGTFVYDCHIHPGMRGTVIVQAGVASRGGT